MNKNVTRLKKGLLIIKRLLKYDEIEVSRTRRKTRVFFERLVLFQVV